MSTTPVYSYSGMFCGERLLYFAEILRRIAGKCFWQLWKVSKEQSTSLVDVKATFKIGLEHIHTWNQSIQEEETKFALEIEPKLKLHYVYALHQYVKELYQHENPINLRIKIPSLQEFLYCFIKRVAQSRIITNMTYFSTELVDSEERSMIIDSIRSALSDCTVHNVDFEHIDTISSAAPVPVAPVPAAIPAPAAPVPVRVEAAVASIPEPPVPPKQTPKPPQKVLETPRSKSAKKVVEEKKSSTEPEFFPAVPPPSTAPKPTEPPVAPKPVEPEKPTEPPVVESKSAIELKPVVESKPAPIVPPPEVVAVAPVPVPVESQVVPIIPVVPVVPPPAAEVPPAIPPAETSGKVTNADKEVQLLPNADDMKKPKSKPKRSTSKVRKSKTKTKSKKAKSPAKKAKDSQKKTMKQAETEVHSSLDSEVDDDDDNELDELASVVSNASLLSLASAQKKHAPIKVK
jgi:hypothetical protein